MRDWISGIDAIADGTLAAASDDASFRRYFRLQSGSDSFIVMDAPPDREDCLPFIRVAGYLESMQLNAPRIIEANLDEGFLLLSDMGSDLYLETLRKNPDDAPRLYADAIAALLTMQRHGSAFQTALPPYDTGLLSFELSLFHDWLCGTHLGLSFDAEEEAAWRACCDVLIDNALHQPQVFVHRDYHSRNLMVTADNNPGILDFQDAVEGPMTYDLVSLLKDCYLRWPAEQVRQWALDYYSELQRTLREQVDELSFCRYFELMGIQRHLKAAGIFARLNHRDGKPKYLLDVPRTLSYITEVGPHYEEMEFLVRLIDDKVMPAMVGER